MIQKQHFKNRTLAAVLLLLMTMLPQLASAYDFKVNGLCYNYNSDGISVTLTYEGTGTDGYGYSGLGGVLNIPSTVTYNGNTYSVTSIGDHAFYNCSGLTSVTIPNSVTSIGEEAFEYCYGLTSVTIGNSVTSIGWSAFNRCSGLTSVTIPNSVTSIGGSAFECCRGLTSVTIPNSVTSIGSYAFAWCTGLTSVTIPNSVTSIGDCAFEYCTGLTSVTIGNSVTTIGDEVFYRCSGLTSVTIPNSVTSIGNYAFSGCSGLTSVTIPNSVTSIGQYAFSDCDVLTSVTIPNSVTSISHGAFSGCSGLTSIVVESGNTKYDSRNNCNAIIETETNTLISGCKNTIIPNSVTSIGGSAFRGCSGLTSVTIPNSVTTIVSGAFSQCSGLTSVTIGNSVTSIGDYAFSGSNSLANIYCEILAPLSINENVFSNYNANLHVYSTSVSAYQSTYPWNKFHVLAIQATGITLSESSHTLKYNGNDTFSFQLTATITPSSASNTNVAWTSSDANVATVSSDGTVTSAGRGTATITATTTDGTNLSASCVVTVLQLATSITLDQQAKTLNVGETFTLVPTILPSNANNKSVTWTSSNSTVASVNTQGQVTALKRGTATIKATTKDGSNLSASCVVTVLQPATGITLSESSHTLKYNGNDTFSFQLTATITPSSASSTNVTWTSSNANVATVSNDGTVTSAGRGTATITATTTDGSNLSASCVVTVLQLATSITLDQQAKTLNVGETFTLVPTILPSNANNKSVTWTSSNSTVASVNSQGKVTALRLGTATIKATTKDGSNLSASCVVTVLQPVNSISLSQTSASIYQNEILTLSATVLPTNASNATLSWSSSDTNVATVDQNGTVTGKRGGTATITATTTDGTNLSASCVVTVIGIYGFKVNGLCYTINSDGTSVTVTYENNSDPSYSNLSGAKNIPSSVTYGGKSYSVTAIGNRAFYGCSGLTSITIQNSVTAIGDSTFYNCSGLTSVTIPNSVLSIGLSAFEGCSGLTKVNISNIAAWCNIAFSNAYGNPLSFAHNLYLNGTKVTNLVIPNSVEVIKFAAFYGCSSLTSVTIPSSVKQIRKSAFCYCSGLTSVTIPNSVTSIGGEAFRGCTGLTSVTIGNSVTSIGSQAFYDCTGLTKVNISDIAAWCNIDFMNNYSNPLTIAHNLYLNNNKVTNLVIPSAVTTIKQFAFNRCTSLTSVTIPNSVTSIGYYAFYYCTGLTSVTIGNSVTSIGESAFEDCTGLTSVTIGNSVTSIGDYAFYYCTGLTEVTIGNSVTEIGNYAFGYCSGLTNIFTRILHPENVTLGSNVFYGVDKSNCILTIPGGTLSLYQNADQWNEFLNMVVYIGLSVAPDVAHVRGAEHRVHELSIDMSNDEAISGVQFLMTLPPGVSLATDSYGYPDVWLDDARRARNHTVSVEPRSGNKYFVLISSPTNKTFSGNTGDILHMNIEVDQYHSATGDYPVTISDIILAEADETEHNVSAAQSTVRMSYLVGDANADVEVDVGDYVVTANYILGHDTGIHFFSDAANANYTNNTAINVTDLVAITNIALELRDKEIKPDVSDFQRAPALTMPGTDYYLSADVIETGIDKTVIAVAVDNDEPIAAMQLDIDLPDGVTLESASVADRASGMNASCGTSPDGKARVVLSSFGTAEIAEGGGDVIMLTLRGKAQRGDLLQFSNVIMPEQSLIEHGAVGDLTLDLNDFTGVNGVTYENVNIYGSDGSVIIESPVEGMARLVRINGMSREVKVEPGRNVYPVNVSHGDIIIATFNGVTKKIQF